MSKQLLQDAVDAMGHLSKTISAFVQRNPGAQYSIDGLYGDSARVMQDLRRAIEAEAATASGAIITSLEWRGYVIERRKLNAFAASWHVARADGSVVSDFEVSVQAALEAAATDAAKN